MKITLACLLFCVALVALSYQINRRACGGSLKIDPYRLALTASAVLLLAVVAEALINPLFELWRGEKLWEYRVLPLHDRNVSALAVLVWFAYGIHLYFTRQTLELKLPRQLNNNYGKALIFGFEAPFICEVSGNLVFLSLANTYYAYYLPQDIGHLTSVLVVPAYIVCIFLGLLVLRLLERLPQRNALPIGLYAACIAFLLAG